MDSEQPPASDEDVDLNVIKVRSCLGVNVRMLLAQDVPCIPLSASLPRLSADETRPASTGPRPTAVL